MPSENLLFHTVHQHFYWCCPLVTAGVSDSVSLLYKCLFNNKSTIVYNSVTIDFSVGIFDVLKLEFADHTFDVACSDFAAGSSLLPST